MFPLASSTLLLISGPFIAIIMAQCAQKVQTQDKVMESVCTPELQKVEIPVLGLSSSSDITISNSRLSGAGLQQFYYTMKFHFKGNSGLPYDCKHYRSDVYSQ